MSGGLSGEMCENAFVSKLKFAHLSTFPCTPRSPNTCAYRPSIMPGVLQFSAPTEQTVKRTDGPKLKSWHFCSPAWPGKSFSRRADLTPRSLSCTPEICLMKGTWGCKNVRFAEKIFLSKTSGLHPFYQTFTQNRVRYPKKCKSGK